MIKLQCHVFKFNEKKLPLKKKCTCGTVWTDVAVSENLTTFIYVALDICNFICDCQLVIHVFSFSINP